MSYVDTMANHSLARNCNKFHRDCVFLSPALDQASQLKLTEIKEKVGSLERLLERDVAKPSTQATSDPSVASPPSQDRIAPEDNEDLLPANDDERDLYPTPMAIPDAAYGDDGDDDDLLDLGIRLGKMRLNERIGGFFRPRISEEVCVSCHLLHEILPKRRSCLKSQLILRAIYNSL